jgi:ankyrin repeat protein
MPKKLDEAFQVTIDRIQRQASAKSKQGMEVLKWTFMAERPLSVAELRHALAAVDSTSSSHLDHNDLPFEKSLTDHCHGLVVLDKETSSLRLVHKSLQDFLQKQHEKKKLFETGHSEIARACLLYMGFSDRTMSSGPLYYPDISDPTFVELVYRGFDRPDILEATSKNLASPHIERFPLLKYAIHFWGFHAKKQMNQEVTDQIHTLFLNGRNSHCISKDLLPLALEIFSDSALRTMIGVNIGGNFTRFYSDLTAFPGLYITVHFGLDGVFEASVDRIHDIDIDLALWKSYCLQTAIVKGRPRIIRTLLDRTDPAIDINAEFADGVTTLLSLASQLQIKNQEAVILLLLQRGADINKRCPRTGLTPLSLAAAWSQYGDSVVRLLLGRGAEIESRDIEGRTALSHAASNWRIGNEAIVKLLLTEGADLDCSDYRGRTPLSHALESDFKVAKLLLNSGANIESRDRDGYTPLLCMLRRLSRMRGMSSHEIQPVKSFVLLLLDKGADISVSCKKGRTALSWAAEIGDREIVTYILGKGADVDLSDNNGLSPLSYAARSGDRQTVLHLLEFGADINSRDNSGIAPLSWAAIWGQVEVVDLFLEKESDINSRDNDGRTPLSYAGFCREVMDILLEKGADIDLSDNTERTPLSYAVEYGSEETVTLLLEKGADINSRDNKGRTPLSWAVCPADSHPNEGVVRLLLDNGASTNSRDNLGRTPLTMITLKLFCSNLGLGLESLPDSTRELWEKLESLLIERGGTF